MNQAAYAVSTFVIFGVLFFDSCETRERMSTLQLELTGERAALRQALERRVDEATMPAPLIYVDCPQVEIEPYDDEPFIPIPIEEILEAAKERRRKLARAKTARPSATAAPDSAPGSQPSSPSAD